MQLEKTIVKTKRWGNSLGIVLPSNIIKKIRIREGDEIKISIEKKGNVLQELRGAIKFKKPAEISIKEFRKEISLFLMQSDISLQKKTNLFL